jgi:hypothetical protein
MGPVSLVPSEPGRDLSSYPLGLRLQLNSMGNIAIQESLPHFPCKFESWDVILLKGGRLWRPRFLINVINANDRIGRVKLAGTGQT